jgi:hypothetical protein
MGDLIEGYGREETPATWTVKKKRSKKSYLLTPLLIVGTILFVVHASNVNDLKDNVFFDATNARCYQTGVGAIGKVEEGNRLTNSVTLIFTSGNRAKYPLSNLKETSCSKLTTAD